MNNFYEIILYNRTMEQLGLPEKFKIDYGQPLPSSMLDTFAELCSDIMDILYYEIFKKQQKEKIIHLYLKMTTKLSDMQRICLIEIISMIGRVPVKDALDKFNLWVF